MQESKGRRQQLGPNRPHTIKSGEKEKWPIEKDGLAAKKRRFAPKTQYVMEMERIFKMESELLSAGLNWGRNVTCWSLGTGLGNNALGFKKRAGF